MNINFNIDKFKFFFQFLLGTLVYKVYCTSYIDRLLPEILLYTEVELHIVEQEYWNLLIFNNKKR